MKSCEFLSMAILFKREIIAAWSVRTYENCSLIFFLSQKQKLRGFSHYCLQRKHSQLPGGFVCNLLLMGRFFLNPTKLNFLYDLCETSITLR